MENSNYVKDKEKLANNLERYSIIADYMDNNKDRVDANRYNQGIPLFHALLDESKGSEEAVKLRDQVYRVFFGKHTKNPNLIENFEGKEALMEEYAMIMDYFDKNPAEVSGSRTHLDNTCNSMQELRNSLPENDADYSKLQEFEKKIKCLLMRDLTNKLKNGSGTGTGVAP